VQRNIPASKKGDRETMKLKELTNKLGRVTPTGTSAASPPTANAPLQSALPLPKDEVAKMSEPEKPKTAFHPAVARRPVDLPPAPSSRIDSSQHDPKTLIVGREITLSGEITACERLLVEGKVEAALGDCRIIEISESGLFKGAAEIQEADVRGRFEGKLTVRGRLMIRATGKVTGEIRYGEIEIERGGTILGQIGAVADAPGIRSTGSKNGTATSDAAD
jgi:cytoskeletal protein CcmA (bactofilin family)